MRKTLDWVHGNIPCSLYEPHALAHIETGQRAERYYMSPFFDSAEILSHPEDYIMAQKKVERKKEMDRRRKRRAERIKERVKEAKAAAKK